MLWIHERVCDIGRRYSALIQYEKLRTANNSFRNQVCVICVKNINFASRPYMYFSEQGNVDDDATFITIFLVSFNLQSCCLMQSAVCGLHSAVCSLQMSYTDVRLEYPSRRSEKVNCHFVNYRLSFRKLQIFISQTTDFHCDFHFPNYRFSFRFVSLHFVSQTTVSRSRV